MNLSEFKKDIKYFFYSQKMYLMNSVNLKTNFIATIVSSWGWTFMTILFIRVIYTGFNDFYGWNFYEMLILLSIGQVAFYLVYIFTPGAVSFLGSSIQNGEIDKYLMRPVKATIAIFTADSNLTTLTPGVFLQTCVFIYALTNNPINTSYIQIILCFFLLIVSYVQTLCFLVILNCASFFVPYLSDGILSAFSEIHELQKYPGSIYPSFLKPIFLFIIPFGLTAYGPAYVLIKGINYELIIIQIMSMLFLLSTSTLLWKKGLKSYTSVSG